MEGETIESVSIKLRAVLEDIGMTEELINFTKYCITVSDVFGTFSNNMEEDTIDSLSIKLCTVLEAIGVTEELINFRRYVYTLRDVLCKTLNNHIDLEGHTFGSRIEGSTTLGH
ncbi:hypothetical protein DPMN_088303 [Dreissena polymorpha]|uniref:Uncharacterized protein n=1 Tax=Dreissena polymorpha TaxID=45954 RepID=A0A9D4KTV3_DREPO|nr:hypothetical protein DPMN_088303 [Dreissena polymorpha]